MILCYCVFNVLWLFVWFFFAKKEIPITVPIFLSDLLPYLLLSGVVMAITHFATMAIDDILLMLLVKILISVLLYVSAALLIRSEELREITGFLVKRNKEVR